MANIWQDAVITNKGIALLTKLIEGTNLNITRAAIGTGTVAVASLMQQTEVSGSMMELSFLHFTYPEQGKVKLPVSLTNDNVDAGFVGKQIGLFASDPDEGEILFLIAQANQFTEVTGVSIPSKTEQPGFSAQWDFVFEYGQTDGITVVVDPAAALTRDIADTLYVSPSTLSEALATKADLGEDGKIPERQLPEMDYIPTSEKGAASGVAELDATGKVPETQLPDMDYDVKGSAADALTAAKAYTDTSAFQTLTEAKAYADAATPAFIYKCTGDADSTAIANIVNDFFNNGTAMNMKLIITGTMGIAFTNTYYAMYINATNTRGARVFLDFSDCYIPEITTATRDFLCVDGGGILDVFGLVAYTTRHGIYCIGTSTNTFTNCMVDGAGTGVRVIFGGTSINTMTNCTINGGAGYGVRCNETSNNTFTNCTIDGAHCGAYCINEGTNIFTNCIIDSSAYGAHCIHRETNIFTNCIIKGDSNGVRCHSTFAGLATFIGCKIIGGEHGVYTLTSRTNVIVKLADCQISGGTQDIYQSTAASTMHWLIKGCSFSKSSIYVNGGTYSASSTVANAYLAIQAYHNLFSQTIS